MCVRRYLSKHHHIARSPLPMSDNAVINCRGRNDHRPSEEVKFDWQMEQCCWWSTNFLCFSSSRSRSALSAFCSAHLRKTRSYSLNKR